MTILADGETSPLFLRAEVSHMLAVVRAEEALDLLLRVLADPSQDVYLREVITFDLAIFRIPIIDLTLEEEQGE